MFVPTCFSLLYSQVPNTKSYHSDIKHKQHSNFACFPDMKTLLSRKRTEVYKSTHTLDVLVRSVLERVRVSQESGTKIIQRMADWDLWRWLTVLGELVSVYISVYALAQAM